MNTLLLAVETIVAGPSLITVLIWLLVFALVVYLVFLIVSYMPLPEPFKAVFVCVVGIILLLVLLAKFGLL